MKLMSTQFDVNAESFGHVGQPGADLEEVVQGAAAVGISGVMDDGL
jgi:hypothetical protein